MAAPTVSTLFTTPVKGFALHSADRVEVDRNGAVGDRDFFMVDDEGLLASITRMGTFASWRANYDRTADVLTLHPADGPALQAPAAQGEPIVAQFYDDRTVAGHVIDGPWSEWLSKVAGRSLRLVRAEDPGGAYDEHAVTLLGEASVADLGQHTPNGNLDRRRFRMLIGFTGAAPYTEDTWNGRTMHIGTAELVVRGPVPRCNATTRHPDTGERDLKTLRLIEEHRGETPNDFGQGLNFGVYADVVTPGSISVGDELLLV
jgi:uncharacterized protein YcbX